MLESGESSDPIRYSIMAVSKDESVRSALIENLSALDARVNESNSGSFRIDATLTKEQLRSLLQSDQVLYVQKAKGVGADMDVVRSVCGANYLENATGGAIGMTGQGVRGEVFDLGLLESHDAFQHPTTTDYPVIHDSNIGTCLGGHGTSVYGIVFGDGSDDSTGRGLLPKGQGIFSSAINCSGDISIPNRCTHTADLVDSDQSYKAVFQTNSWGHDNTAKYDCYSSEMDDILFQYDILTCQSQGNCGADDGCHGTQEQCKCRCDDGNFFDRCSRPEAWAKNIVSVGGTRHFNYTDTTKYEWCQSVNSCSSSTCPTCIGTGCTFTCNQDPPCPSCGTSICGSRGDASDRRIKPDLVHFTDCIHATCANDDSCYTNGGSRPDFGGTSAATPITCGMFGLFFQMWADDSATPGYGIFGNAVVSCNPGSPDYENCAFKRRPHMTTAKAMMINTAFLVSQTDLARLNHGWGMADVGRLYSRRNNFPIICDECRVLSQSDATAAYTVTVPSGALALRATMTYADPAGDPESTVSAVNDLDLKVTSPGGSVYWGNCGLRDSNWSLSTCTDDHPYPDSPDNEIEILDTVENVFLQNPQAGTWTINVIADVIAQDGHVETEATDVDFALVVSIDPDCNGNGIADPEDVRGGAADCNHNGVPDSCDIASGHSVDCDINGVPDECQTAACCGASGSCSVLNKSDCTSSGGTFLGPCHSCIFTGACCGYDGGDCTSSVTECACLAHGGYHWQATTSCRFVNCSIYGPEGGGDGP